MVDNNLSEAFNRTLLSARSKFIISLLEDIRVVTMTRVTKKKIVAENWRGNYGSLVMKKLNESILGSAGWDVASNGVEGYEIKKGQILVQGKFAFEDTFL